MIKIRNKRIALLLVLAMLATMFVGVGTASSATQSDNNILNISKSINKNIADDGVTADNLGYVKVSVDAEDVELGNIYWEVDLPSDVEWAAADTSIGATKGGDLAHDTYAVTATGAAVNFTLPLPQVIVDSSAADDIQVNVFIRYMDDQAKPGYIDSFEGDLLLAQKGEDQTNVTAASPKSVSMGFGKKVAKITFSEEQYGSMEKDSVVALELPDGFEWNAGMSPATLDGFYNLTASVTYDDNIAKIKILTESTAVADKLKFTGYINVYPDAPDGDVVVEVYDDTPTGTAGDPDSNIDDTDLTIAVVGGADVTVTAKDTSSSADYIYRATEDKELWKITLETTGSWTEGDDLLLELPDGVEFMESLDASGASAMFAGFINHGLYDDNQGLWLTIEEGMDGETSDLVLENLMVGVTPKAKVGDLVVTLSGDVVDTTVVASAIVDKATVTATKPDTKIGLDVASGVVTLVENKKKAFKDGQEIWAQLPNGVSFSSTPTVKVNGDEVDASLDNEYDDDVLVIELDNLKTNSLDTIEISDIELDIDSRYNPGSEITLKFGGIDWIEDDVNELVGTDGAQFEKEADDSVLSVVIAGVKSATATKVVFTIGQNSYVKDGVTFAMDVAPFTQNNRTFIPVRFLANALDVPDQNIFWDQLTQTVTLVKEDNVVQLKLGSTTRLINAMPDTMDVAPIAMNNRLFLPARFVAEAFEAIVGWDAAAPNQVTISID